MAYSETKQLAKISIELSEEVEKTWSDAIFDNRYKANRQRVYNFNEALRMLFNEKYIISEVNKIDGIRTKLKSNMLNLNNPPKNYKAAYDDLVEMYSSVIEISNMATNPSGSLQSYRENMNVLNTNVNKKIAQIEVRIPK